MLFIATANSLRSVPGPLRDRMEVIEVPGYAQEDKVAIARVHLVPKQAEMHGIAGAFGVTDDGLAFLGVIFLVVRIIRFGKAHALFRQCPSTRGRPG